MKWLRGKSRKQPCSRRDDCISPSGHYGPCQIQQDGHLVFVNDDGTLWEEPCRPKVEPEDPRF